MSAIERIEIFDFQSHHRTVLEPAPAGQLTVIVGPSDSGKTAVIRALRWLYYNVPQGTDFINVRTTTARVAVAMAGGCQVIRERHRKNYNRYQVISGPDPSNYEGFGGEVPAEVQEATGVRPVTIGDLELNLNLAEQLDGPFLGKSVSAGARAKVLGKLAGTEEVDYAAKQLNADLYRRRQDEKNLVAEIARLQKELKKYDYLTQLEQTINQVAGILSAVKEAQEKKVRLEKLRDDLKAVNQQIQSCNRQIDSLSMFIIAAEPLAGGTEASVTRHAQLVVGSRKLQEIASGIAAVRDTLDRTAGIPGAAIILDSAAANAGALSSLKKLKSDLSGVDKGILAADAIIDRTKTAAEAERLAIAATADVERASRLRVISGNLGNIDGKIRQCSDLITRLAPVIEAGPVVVEAAASLEKAARLRPLRESMKNIDAGIKRCAEQVDRLAPLAGAEKGLKEIEEAHNRLVLLKTRQGSLNSWSRDAAELDKAVRRYDATVRALQEEYENLLAEAGVCPTCGAEITRFKLKEVI